MNLAVTEVLVEQKVSVKRKGKHPSWLFSLILFSLDSVLAKAEARPELQHWYFSLPLLLH